MRPSLLLALAAASILLGCAASAGSGGAGAAANGAQPMQPVPVTAPATAAGTAAGSAAGKAGAPELLQRLRALETASTCRAASDCRAVPIGARLCGGPSAWLAVSAARLPEAAPLAERYTALRKAANADAEKEGRVSTCQVIPEPAVGCAGGFCRTLPSAPSGRAD
jgi:hypothetical protein